MEECAIDRRLTRLRATFTRVGPEQLAAAHEAGAVLVDVRPVELRDHDGELPGAVVIGLNVLEWRLDPTSPNRVPEASYDARFVLVCNEGYSSTLAAHSLRELGLNATDLVGGFQALRQQWAREAGRPAAE